MLCLETGQLRLSRDIKWLGQSYGSYTGAPIREDANDDNDDDPHGSGEDINSRYKDRDNTNDSVSHISTVNTSKAETNTTPAERVYDRDVATNAEPDEGWHVVRSGRETIEYEARPTGRTRSGVQEAVIATATPTTTIRTPHYTRMTTKRMIMNERLLLKHGITIRRKKEKDGEMLSGKNSM
jgi:hypothetical protein